MKRVCRPRQFETNKSNYTMIGFELVRKNNSTPTMNSDSVKEMFPDWAEIKPGDWSGYHKALTYGLGHTLEIGLYREPIDELGRIATDEEADIGIYDGRYTLQVFDGDDVIFCADVDDQR